MLYCWDLLLPHSSLREWASVPRSRPLVLMNNNLVSLGFFSLGMLPNGKFSSSSIVFISLVWTTFSLGIKILKFVALLVSHSF